MPTQKHNHQQEQRQENKLSALSTICCSRYFVIKNSSDNKGMNGFVQHSLGKEQLATILDLSGKNQKEIKLLQLTNSVQI